mmetsp:Transcript_92199/g.173761  ORF Transcript_92199/g.173761 Transcript_92199/m.173761 type:complete len:143 (-) Transcript_92199:253-681(-)
MRARLLLPVSWKKYDGHEFWGLLSPSEVLGNGLVEDDAVDSECELDDWVWKRSRTSTSQYFCDAVVCKLYVLPKIAKSSCADPLWWIFCKSIAMELSSPSVITTRTPIAEVPMISFRKDNWSLPSGCKRSDLFKEKLTEPSR